MNKLSSVANFFGVDCQSEVSILGVSDDSRNIKSGYLFVALPGINSHGVTFLDDAILNGAACILSDQLPSNTINIPYIFYKDLKQKIAQFLFKFYELDPDHFLFHGVTGTNGKTSTAFMAHQIVRKLEKPSCYIGTFGAIINDELIATKGNTTPGIFELCQLLTITKPNQKTSIFLELSSHALDQERLSSLTFVQTMLLNIYSDHLDYHSTLDKYIEAKLSILTLTSPNTPLVFRDSFWIESNIQAIERKKKVQFISSKESSAPLTYSKQFNREFPSKIFFQFPSFKSSVEVSLFPQFNLDNFACAVGLISNSFSTNELKNISYADIKLPPGRSDLLKLDQGHVLIDFAHDPESMKNILFSLTELYDEILLIFGCGGDRDKEKRTRMMRVAEEFSQNIIFTSDNNRNESFERIAEDATQDSNFQNLVIIKSREEAIKQGLLSLNRSNILVILGKGHEIVMEEKGNNIPFNDRECVLKSARQ
jgi:UDP-N-acetylmuramoyl-L-alanyl-D-glutamate--2,6-diaminopimelate ligase